MGWVIWAIPPGLRQPRRLSCGKPGALGEVEDLSSVAVCGGHLLCVLLLKIARERIAIERVEPLRAAHDATSHVLTLDWSLLDDAEATISDARP